LEKQESNLVLGKQGTKGNEKVKVGLGSVI
jgi:hypothetical protein